jgi:hypothetical protein
VRSERQLMEQINYNLLFRWFVGQQEMLGAIDAVCDVAKRIIGKLKEGAPPRGAPVCRQTSSARAKLRFAGSHHDRECPHTWRGPMGHGGRHRGTLPLH